MSYVRKVEIGDCVLYEGDCLSVMPELEDNSIDSIVTDPPAGIGFMGKEWDKDKGGRDQWIEWMSGIAAECMRVLKPGGHALVWAIPRTSHWTATAWENAGFEVRDRIAHAFGTGFPKSLSVSKAIDRAAGAEREVTGYYESPENTTGWKGQNKVGAVNFGACRYEDGQRRPITAPATPEAVQWDGWGTALKPAIEDWWLLRKPLSEPTVAANVLKWGTGALNIGECRVETSDSLHGGAYCNGNKKAANASSYATGIGLPGFVQPAGRFPANLIHDGSDEVVALFPVTSNKSTGPTPANTTRTNANGSVYGFATYPIFTRVVLTLATPVPLPGSSSAAR